MLNMIPITNCSLRLLQLPFLSFFFFFFPFLLLYHIISLSLSLFRMSFGRTGWRKGMGWESIRQAKITSYCVVFLELDF